MVSVISQGGRHEGRPAQSCGWRTAGNPLMLGSKTRKSRCVNELLNNPDPRPEGHFAGGQNVVLNPRFDQL